MSSLTAKNHREQFKFLFENCSDSLVVFDPKGNIINANENASKLFKCSTSELLHANIQDILPPEILSDITSKSEILKKKFETQIANKEGRLIPVVIHIQSHRQEKDIIHYAFIRDLRERQRLLDELNGRSKELACLFSINKAKEEKDTLDEIIADIANNILLGLQSPDEASASITHLDCTCKSAKFTETPNFILEKLVVNNNDVEIKIFYPEKRKFCLNEKNLLTAVAQSLSRIIKRKEDEEHLVWDRKNLANIIQEIGIGISVIDRDYKIIWANEILEQSFGNLDKIRGTHCYKTYHKREKICHGCLMENTFTKGTVEMETKTVISPGKKAYYQLTTAPIFDKNNQVIQGLTLSQNVTNIHEMQEKLRKYNENLEVMVAKRTEQLIESEEKYRTFMENSSDLMAILNAESEFVYVNESFARILGYKKNELLNLKFLEIIENDEVYSFENLGLASLKEQGKIDQVRLKLSSRYGRKIVGELNATAITDQSENYKGARIIIRDITGRIQAEEEIKKLVITDNLTGLYNQRYFYDQLAKEVERAKRTGRPLSLLLFDIDNFKSYNDAFGHLDGDNVLAKMGKIVSQHIRNIDLGFRYGGEEFTVILPDSDINQAVRVARRLRHAFSSCLFMPESKSEDMVVVYKTISAGIAQYRVGDSFKALVKNADDAMYIAKRAGGDRIHIFQAYHS